MVGKQAKESATREAEDFAHQVMEKAFEITMKQQGGHLICNNDDKGIIALERSGMQAVDKQRKVRNISNCKGRMKCELTLETSKGR
eukprot:scaffold3156_cov268-Chaetoceros_neogracile.AAC.3